MVRHQRGHPATILTEGGFKKIKLVSLCVCVLLSAWTDLFQTWHTDVVPFGLDVIKIDFGPAQKCGNYGC